MSRSQTQIEIGNLVVKFGEEHNLLDLFEQIVRPAIFDSTLVRTYGETTYLIYKPEILSLKDDVAIVGLLVKDTVLEREQILENGELKPAAGTMESSPSSFFVLLLSCHRVLFVKQHKGSPPLDAFRSTLSQFIRTKHRDFVRALADTLYTESGAKMTLAQAFELYPKPTVDLKPLASNESVETFLKKFNRLETITAQLFPTNSEIDNDGLFKAVRASERRLKSEKTTLKYENKAEGLNKKEAASQISSLAKQGNHEIKLVGVDNAGERLEGNNENFKIKIPVDELPDDPPSAAIVLYRHFESLKTNEIITVPPPDDTVKEKMKKIRKNL